MIKKVPDLYWLRWRYQYFDHKPDIWGEWNRQGDEPNQAWNKDKNNLLYAMIEAKNIITKVTKPIVVVAGMDFCNFEWRAIKSLRTGKTEIIGLEIRTRNEVITAYRNKRIERNPRPDKDLQYHYAGFGK